jgi:hypothetical protein
MHAPTFTIHSIPGTSEISKPLKVGSVVEHSFPNNDLEFRFHKPDNAYAVLFGLEETISFFNEV